MAAKTLTSAAKKRVAVLELGAAEYLLELAGPSLLTLARDKRRWEEMRRLLLKVASANERGTRPRQIVVRKRD
jgi:hypothetical protein